MESKDIIQIDLTIRKKLKSEIFNITKYKDELTKLSPHSSNYTTLETKIQDIESGALLAEYIYLTEKYIKEYTDIIKIPMNVSFFNKPIKQVNTQLTKITGNYLEIASNYTSIQNIVNETVSTLTCKCGSINFKYNDNVVSCEQCSLEIHVQSSQNSFKDSDRINTSQKYKYKKKVHFRDTVNQYQGKQNKKTTDEILYNQLEIEFEKMGLLIDSKNWYEKHKAITKDIIYMVLRETSNNNRYEDINYIHNYYTGIPCPDISYLEHQLYQDFDRVVEAYDNFDVDRKNFLHSKYVLYQLLRIYKFKVDKADFDILKTRERLLDHDNIWENICFKLEKPFYPCV